MQSTFRSFLNIFPEKMKKRTLWYLFDRYLGHFLSEKLTLDQLSIDIIDGKGCINDISLDVNSLNEELSFIPLNFLDGCFIQEISVGVPWSSLLTESCSLHLNGAIFVCSLLDPEKGKNIIDSHYLSKSFMSSSMQMAEEIVGDVNDDQFEGLEIFAQLIDSVLRRIEVVSTNTSIIIKQSKVNGSNQSQIEFKIKHLKCEENFVEEKELSGSNKDVINVPKIISKRLTFENVQMLMDDCVIWQIEGKHIMEIKVDDIFCDIQLYFASFSYAFLNSQQIDKLLQIVKLSNSSNDKTNRFSSDKMMSSTDYARIEQQLQRDVSGFPNLPNAFANSLLACGKNAWASGGDVSTNSSSIFSDAKFLQFNNIPNDEKNFMTKADSNVKNFKSTIKLPAIVLCIFNSFSPSSFSNIEQSFLTLDSLDSSIDAAISTSHLRLILMPIQIDWRSNHLSISFRQMLISEKNQNISKPILWTSNEENESINMQVDFKESKINFVFDVCTYLTLDPTFIERIENFIMPSNSSSSFKYLIKFFCGTFRVKLLFPIPDLRPKKSSSSFLRNESIEFLVTNISLSTNFLTYEIVSDNINAFLLHSDVSYHLLEAQSQDGKKININIKRGPSASSFNLFEDNLNKTLNNAEMEESIYINCSEKPEVTPFATKRKVIKSTQDENEQIVTSNDRQTSFKYFENCQSLTQLQIEMSAPVVFLKLKSKQILDLLYNRFGNDLALWTPIKVSSNKLLEDNPPLVNPILNNKQVYFACKSGLVDSIESDSSFHSIDVTMNKLQNIATWVSHLEKLYLEMGEETNHHLLVTDDLFMGFVIGLNDDKSNVFSFHGSNLNWKFCNKLIIGANYFGSSSNALNLTFETNVTPERIKEIKFALQLTDCMLFKESLAPFKSFWNFINVKNEEVLGYQPFRTQVELHINILNGAILCNKANCRPALITLECGYLTSMVVENIHQTLLRIITEEASLYFIKNNLSKYDMRNYVCIVDSGLIDLNLKFSEDSKIDFKASNNIINIRTCYDSLKALCQLLLSFIQNNEQTETAKLENFAHSNLVEENGVEKSCYINNDLIEDAINDVENRFHIEKSMSCNFENNRMDKSGFWLLGDDDIGSGIKATIEPKVRILTSEPIEIIDNYYGLMANRSYTEVLSTLLDRYLLEEMTLIIYFYGGKDFDELSSQLENEEETCKMEDDTYQTASHPHSKFEEPKIRFLDNSVLVWENIDLKSGHIHNQYNYPYTASNLRKHGGKLRQNDVCVQVSLSKIKSLFDKFDKNSSMPWRFTFMVNTIEIRDRVSKSKIKKMLYEYSSESMPKRNSANMITVQATTFKNTTDLHEECDLKISVKPLRINIDQDTIMFLIDFFDHFKNLKIEDNFQTPCSTTKQNSIDPNLTTFDDNIDSNQPPPYNLTSVSSKPPSIYIKSFIFSPDVPIRLDYHGKRVDFEQGALPGLLMGLAHLNQSELCLKRLHNKHGILGLDRVFLYALSEWYSDLKKRQLPSIIGSIGPLNSVRQLIQGLVDLIWIPVDQYRKDRRLVRGIQRGASSFSSSTAMAVLDLANRLVNVIHGTAQFAHDVVSASSRAPQSNYRGQLPSSQPRDLREGVATAYTVMREGFNETYRNVANVNMQAEGYSEAVGEFIRQIPSNIFKPIIKVSEATSNVLVGMRNQLTPEARKDDQYKWKN